MSFVNRNVCKSFSINPGVTKTQFESQECSEVIVRAANACVIYDHMNPNVGFALNANDIFTFRGVTNSNQISATSSGIIYYRTQYYSNMPGV